jgi:hypothetical protein
MKVRFSFLILAVILISCKSKEGSIQIFSQEYDDYRITISTINTKINDVGIAQCSKYARTTVSDTLYTNYGLKLKNVLAVAYKTTPKYIKELPFDSLKNKYLDIKIENYTANKLNYDSILALGISKAFGFKITPIDTVVDGYELIVIDKEKLKQSQSDCKGGVIKYKDGIWTATASGLFGLTKIVDEYSKSYISFDVPNQNCYSFEFVTGSDFDKINTKLKPIGFMFNRTSIHQTFYKIKTVANNTYKQ